VPLLTRYGPPGELRDLRDRRREAEFLDAWHEAVDGLVSRGTGQWFDPLRAEADIVASRDLSWMGFPRQLFTGLLRDDRAVAFERAEKAPPPDPQPGEPEPEPECAPCGQPDELGRGWRTCQAEYFEWHTVRDEATGKVRKVVFITETPEYWNTLAAVDPDAVVALYQQLVSPDVQKGDLFDGGTYNPMNAWNTKNGIVHYVMSANSLGAAIGLARFGASTTITGYTDNYDHRRAQAPHSTDDYLIREVGALARKGYHVTVKSPVGLYIDGWDDTGWTRPDGSPVGDYWKVVRGRRGAALRVEYEVPEREGGTFLVGDIRIGGRPVEHGGQLAEHISLGLPVLVARRVS